VSATEQFWAGEFGSEYHKRNRPEWQQRVPFWESAMQFTSAHSVLEVGCGPGWNLLAIQAIARDAEMYGIEINPGAVEEARQQGLDVRQGTAVSIAGLYDQGSIDMVFTAGVLIHVPPDELETVMRAIAMVSAQYVLAIEYAADTEQMIDYRGNADRLWKRPYGQLYQDMGLRLLSEGVAGGFNECTYWLLQKG